jgi:hypothetical protein
MLADGVDCLPVQHVSVAARRHTKENANQLFVFVAHGDLLSSICLGLRAGDG